MVGNDGNRPNLEKIASDLAKVDEKYSLDQVMMGLESAFYRTSTQYDKKSGKVTYKTEFSDKEKKQLAEDMFEALSYHVHINIYGMSMKKWEELKKDKGPGGEIYADGNVEKFFGINRDFLRRTLDQYDEINTKLIEKIMEKSMEKHVQEIHKPIYEKLEEEHTPYLKEWVKKKVGEYSLDPKIAKQVDKVHLLQDILPLYGKIAKDHYKKEKKAK